MLNIVIETAFKSHRFELLSSIMTSLTCDRDLEGLHIFLKYGGWEPYDYKCHPEYKYKSPFADSCEPVEVYHLVVMSEKEKISDEQNAVLERKILCLAELHMPD